MNPLLLGPLFEMGKAIIDKIWPDKTAHEVERAKAELALATLAQEGDLKRMATQMSAIIAEAQSADPWTSRARPSFMYVMYVMILASIPMGVLSAFKPDIAAGIAHGMQAWLAAIPEALYTLFGVGYLGYTASRGFEKRKGISK